MALIEKELEKQLFEAGNKLLSPPSTITELISCLDRVERLLSQVEQSPSKSLRKALSPSMKSLIKNEFLRQSDIDVKVAVASCISEITRITAPDIPYDDDQMKVVFELIVLSFEKLDDTSSRSYMKRTSILETVAKVRSCVVMLDLECDDLIVEMFQHFFRTIRNEHPANVVTSMETIMTLILEESEDVSVKLVSSILNVLNIENKEVLPIARQLGERVFEKCVNKIKPCLEQAMKSLNTTEDDYPEVVFNVLDVKSEGTETRDADATSKNVVDENNVVDQPSEKAVEVALETRDDAPPSQEAGPTTLGSPKSLVSNGKIEKEIEDTSTGNENVKEANSEPHGEEKETGKTKVEHSDDEKLLKSRPKPKKISKKKGKKTNSSKKPSKPIIKDEKEVVEKSKSESHEEDDKNDENAQNESLSDKKDDNTFDEPVNVPSRSSSGTLEDENASKKLESEEKEDEPVEPSSVDVSKKKNVKSVKKSGKKKQGSAKVTIKKDSAKNPSNDDGKKSVGAKTPAAKPSKDENDEEKGSKSSSKRKRTCENKACKYGEELVGSKVHVWWPDDKKFYAGVIERFDPATGKHKITYNDGDVEVLKLKKEKWKLADGSVSHDQGHSSDDDSSDETPETPKAKKAKTSPVVGAKQGKTEDSAKKVGASSSKSKASSKSPSKPKDETLKSISKSKKNKGVKSEDPKSGGKSKDNKSKQETPKTVSKSRAKSGIIGNKSKSNSKVKEVPSSEEEEDEEMEASPESVKTLENSKKKSGSKSQKSAKKRKISG